VVVPGSEVVVTGFSRIVRQQNIRNLCLINYYHLSKVIIVRLTILHVN